MTDGGSFDPQQRRRAHGGPGPGSCSVSEPVPADVVAAAKATFTWRTIDAELAALTFDSVADADALAGVRGGGRAPGAHVRVRRRGGGGGGHRGRRPAHARGPGRAGAARVDRAAPGVGQPSRVRIEADDLGPLPRARGGGGPVPAAVPVPQRCPCPVLLTDVGDDLGRPARSGPGRRDREGPLGRSGLADRGLPGGADVSGWPRTPGRWRSGRSAGAVGCRVPARRRREVVGGAVVSGLGRGRRVGAASWSSWSVVGRRGRDRRAAPGAPAGADGQAQSPPESTRPM